MVDFLQEDALFAIGPAEFGDLGLQVRIRVFQFLVGGLKLRVGGGQPPLQDGAIALPEKRLAEREQQATVHPQGGAADGNLVVRYIPDPLRRKTELFGHTLEREGFRVTIEDLAGDECSKMPIAPGEWK